MFKKKTLWIATGIGLLLLGSLAFRYKDKYFEMAKSLDLMASVYRDLNSFYVDSLDPSALMQSGIEAMTQSLDPYTHYYPEKELDQLDFMTTGHYAGIGASFREMNDSIVISALFPNAPFDKAGFKPGDIILSLDGHPTTGLDPEKVHALLEGQPGTFLKVSIKRPWTNQIIHKKVKRSTISIPPVAYKTVVNNNIGYIRFQQFTEGSAHEFKQAFQELKKKNPDLKGLIIDLRDNPGGLLQEAVQISNLFLPVGDTIVSVRGKVPNWNHVYTATEKPMDTQIPIAVLVNSHSASAAEILSGALQDLDRGIIVGQKSFGKGLVQITRNLPYDAKVKITVARYYTPSGRCIQAIDYTHDNGGAIVIPDSLQQKYKTADGRVVMDKGGITPDIVVSDTYLSSLGGALVSNNVIFRFATRYAYNHPKIPLSKNFVLSDSTFSSFEDFVEKHPIQYTTRSEHALEQFRANAISEGYFDSVRAIFHKLKRKAKSDTHQSIKKHQQEIRRLLTAEIMNCYYSNAGSIAARIRSDKAVAQASAILKKDSLYHAVLR